MRRMLARSFQGFAGWIAALLPLVFFLSLFAYGCWALWSQGYTSLDEMDWDGDGSTSLWEVVRALEVGKKDSSARPGCTDYFSLKTGQPVTTRCPAGSQP